MAFRINLNSAALLWRPSLGLALRLHVLPRLFQSYQTTCTLNPKYFLIFLPLGLCLEHNPSPVHQVSSFAFQVLPQMSLPPKVYPGHPRLCWVSFCLLSILSSLLSFYLVIACFHVSSPPDNKLLEGWDCFIYHCISNTSAWHRDTQ